MDYRNTPRQSTGLTNAAFTLALISIAACAMLYLSIPFGCLAIILALLGRGGERITHRGKLAVIIGISTIVISTVMTTVSAYRIYKDPIMRQQFMAAMEYYSQFYTSEHSAASAPAETAAPSYSFVSEGGDAA